MKSFEIKENTHIVLKKEDLLLALSPEEMAVFYSFLARYNILREQRGKSVAKYYIVNQDEPYAEKVLDVIIQGEALK